MVSSSSDVQNVGSSAVGSATLLIGLQLFSRLFTFGLNQAMVRMASPKAFGTAAIQFELLLSTILFLSREGVRNSLLRAWPKDKSNKKAASIENVAFMPLIIGLPLAFATVYLYGSMAAQDTRDQPYFQLSIYIYALAALMELLSEPMHNRAMGEVLTSVRVRAEGVGVTSRTVITFIVLLWDYRRHGEAGEMALLAFAAGQLAYGAFTLGTYLSYFGVDAILPQVAQSSNITQFVMSLDKEVLGLSLTMTAQSVFKHVLTEGDKFILSWISPLQDQGGYALAVNYGSLIARIVFQPIEEIIRVYFSKTLTNTRSDPSDTQPPNHTTGSTRVALQHAASALISILSIQASFSVLLLAFGTSYINVALSILLPPAYLATSAPHVLAAWVWYIPVLAVNGACEAFMSSVATPSDLNRQSRWMAGFSFIFIASSVGFYAAGLGDSSLVYANILNLSARIIFCLHFMSSYFTSRGVFVSIRAVIPDRVFLLFVGISYMLIRIDNGRLRLGSGVLARADVLTIRVAGHVVFGGVLAVACLGMWWVRSGRFLKQSMRSKTE